MTDSAMTDSAMTDSAMTGGAMTGDAKFLRQTHPSWITPEGRLSKQTFLPTPKDNDKLSGYDGDKTTPEESFQHYTQTLDLLSAAVCGLASDECEGTGLPVVPSPMESHPFHVHLDFSALDSRRKKESAAKRLRAFAEVRGFLYTASESAP